MHDFWIFAFAALMLNITPGNDMIYVASRSTTQGVQAGIVSALGIAGGCLMHLFAAVAGLSAIIAQSASAFNLIKYSGAAYLIYLGIKALVSRSRSFQLQQTQRPASLKKVFWQGVMTNVLNPKVALFFLAFLPQFIDVAALNQQRQLLLLGIWFNCSGTLVNVAVAVFFGKLGTRLNRFPGFIRWQQKVMGTILVALGLKVAITT